MKLLTSLLLLAIPTVLLAQDKPSISFNQYVGICTSDPNVYFLAKSQVDSEQILFVSSAEFFVRTSEQVVDQAGLLVVLSNQDTGTVSVALTTPDGRVCELITGENFEPM